MIFFILNFFLKIIPYFETNYFPLLIQNFSTNDKKDAAYATSLKIILFNLIKSTFNSTCHHTFNQFILEDDEQNDHWKC